MEMNIPSRSGTTPIARSFDPVVTAVNERCYILVRLVFVNCFIADMDILLELFLPIGVVNNIDSDIRLSIQVKKYSSVPALILLLAFCLIILLRSTFFLAMFSILLLAFVLMFRSELYFYFPYSYRKISYDFPDVLPGNPPLSNFPLL